MRSKLREDYLRGIPDFALGQVAAGAADDMRRHLRAHINQVVGDPTRQRKMLAAANVVLEELEEDIKKLLEEKLLQFVRNT